MKNFRNQTRNAVISTALAAGIILGISGCDFKPTEVFSEPSVPAISQAAPAQSEDGGLKYGDPVKQEATQVVFNLADLSKEELQKFSEVLDANLLTLSSIQQDYLKAVTDWKYTGYVSVTGHKVYENSTQFMIFNGDEVLTTEDKTGIDLRSDQCGFYSAAGMSKLFGRNALIREDGTRIMIAPQELAADYVDCDTVLLDGVKVSGEVTQSVVGSWIKLGALTNGEISTVEQVQNKAIENGGFGKEMVKIYSNGGLSVFASVEGAVSIHMNNMLLPKIGAAVIDGGNGIHLDGGELNTDAYDLLTNTQFKDKLENDEEFKFPEFVTDGVVTVKNGAPDGTDVEMTAMKTDTNGNITLNLQMLTKMVGLQFIVAETEAGVTMEIVDDTLINRMMYGQDLGTIAEGEVPQQFQDQMHTIKVEMEAAAAEKYAAEQAAAKAKFEEQQKKDREAAAKEEQLRKDQQEKQDKEPEDELDQGGSQGGGSGDGSQGGGSGGGGSGSHKEPAIESTNAGRMVGSSITSVGEWSSEMGAWWATNIAGSEGWLTPNGSFLVGW